MTLGGFSVFDVAAVLCLLVVVVWGMVKGMARLALGFIGCALGWYLALRYCEPVAVMLRKVIPSSGGKGFEGHRIAAFILIFFVVLIGMGLLAWLITRALQAVKLGWLNRLAGGGMGLLVAIALICASTIPLLGLLSPDGAVMKGSRLAPYAVAGGEYLKALAPESMGERFTAAAKIILNADASEPKPEPGPRPR